MDFEPLVRAIRMRLAYDQTRDEIHKAMVEEMGASEEMFFLAWHAATMLNE